MRSPQAAQPYIKLFMFRYIECLDYEMKCNHHKTKLFDEIMLILYTIYVAKTNEFQTWYSNFQSLLFHPRI